MTLAITPALLTAAGASPHGADLYAAPLAASVTRRGLSGTAVIEALLAELLHESAAMTTVSEDMAYTSAPYLRQVFPSHFPGTAAAMPFVRQPVKLGNLVYASIGGWDFRGRGLGQITGHPNYAALAANVGRPLSGIGAWMETPEGAADSAVWFFVQRGCAEPAARGDLQAVRRLWAGSLVGMADVQKWAGQVARAVNGSPLGRPMPVASVAQTVVAHGMAGSEQRVPLSLTGDDTADLNNSSFSGTLDINAGA